MNITQLNEMSKIDIDKADFAALINIGTVSIDQALPQTKRIEQYLRQIQNPYCFVSDGISVKMRFAKTERQLSHLLCEYFSRLKSLRL